MPRVSTVDVYPPGTFSGALRMKLQIRASADTLSSDSYGVGRFAAVPRKREGGSMSAAQRFLERFVLGRANRARRFAVVATMVVTAGLLAVAEPAVAKNAPTPWPGGIWQPDVASYGMTVVQNVPVTMSDGVVLFANIGYPSDPTTGVRAPGQFPVLLTQNPYIFETQPDPFYVDRGYIFVSVTVRGTNNSELSASDPTGPLTNDLFSPRETQDGVELVNWAAHQLDGSNGIIGLTGCSQLGINQIFTAAAVGPHSPVKAILPACASNGYSGAYFAGGIPGQTLPLFADPNLNLSGSQHAPENLAAGTALYDEVLAGGPRAYNGTYWQERTTSPTLAKDIVRNGIPALLWSGYNAPDGAGALQFYAALQNAASGRPLYGPMGRHQRATGRYQIVVGNWGHGVGLDESIDLEWYDTWLKGEHTNMTDTSTPLHLYDNQANTWINASSYPLDSSYDQYRLQANGALSPTQGWSRQSDGTASITWGQPDQTGTTLTYNTRPFTSSSTLAGPISATVYASSSNTNLELIATLFDVGPDGTATQISTGDLLGSMKAVDLSQSWFDRNGVMILPTHPYTADKYVPAGRTARYDITMLPTVWTLVPGHALRLVLSTQSPTSACTSLISALSPPIPCEYTAPQQATLPGGQYQIKLGDSSVNLPLVPTSSLAVTNSGTTPTSNGLTEPLDWSSPGHHFGR